MTLLFLAATGALLLAAGGYLYWVLAHNLEARDRALLLSKVQVMRSLLQGGAHQFDVLASEIEHETAESPLRYYLRVLNAAGQVQIETPGMEAQLPPALFPVPGDRTSADSERYQASGSFLLVSAMAGSHAFQDSDLVLQAALDTSADAALLADYRRNLLVILGLGLAFAAGSGGWAVRLGLRPIAAMAEVAQRINASQLHARIQAERWPAELRALSFAMNGMLDRLEDSFGRLARFSGDLAHELRTPITNLRGEAEVALSRCRSAEEYEQVLASCLEECDRLGRMIDGLLFVARADDPRTAVPRLEFDVRTECEVVCDFYEALATEQGVSVACEGAGRLRGDSMLFRRAVGNLVANALRHTPSGGQVVVRASALPGGGVGVAVIDTGGGIAPEHLPRIFDRFYRIDPARSGVSGGTGLGLAIVQSIVKLHGGSVEVESEVGRGTSFLLRFPVHS